MLIVTCLKINEDSHVFCFVDSDLKIHIISQFSSKDIDNAKDIISTRLQYWTKESAYISIGNYVDYYHNPACFPDTIYEEMRHNIIMSHNKRITDPNITLYTAPEDTVHNGGNLEYHICRDVVDAFMNGLVDSDNVKLSGVSAIIRADKIYEVLTPILLTRLNKLQSFLRTARGTHDHLRYYLYKFYVHRSVGDTPVYKASNVCVLFHDINGNDIMVLTPESIEVYDSEKIRLNEYVECDEERWVKLYSRFNRQYRKDSIYPYRIEEKTS